eukprot:gene5206-6483_t
MKLLLVLISTILLNSLYVSAHGMMSYPVARQFLCNQNPSNQIWWPDDGTGIVDPQCRAAYQYVRTKYGGDANAARNQFVQQNEYAVMIPNYAAGFSALTAAVPNSICSAHAVDKNAQFGDKSGMSIPFNWPSTLLPVTNPGNGTTTINLDFCATAAHNPSYWEFYLTKNSFNVQTQTITWSDVDLVAYVGNVFAGTNTNPKCPSGKAFFMTITIPVRTVPSVLITRWQRNDPMGECFINCSDVRFS